MSQKFDPITGQPIIDGGNESVVGFDPITGEPVTGEAAFNVIGFSTMDCQPTEEAIVQDVVKFDPMTGKPVTEEVKQEAAVKFDSMTGKPVTEEVKQEAAVKFDSMTGKPVTEEVKQEAVVRFDPMTGKPVTEEVKQEPVVRFDPMTGKPITGEEPRQEKTVRFDPMTGKPIMEDSIPRGNEGTFDPMTGKPVVEKKSAMKGKMKIILPIVIGAAVVVIAVVALVFSGAFLSKQNKILLATVNTFKDSTGLTQALEGLKIITSDSFALSAEMEVDGNSIQATFASKDSEMQLSAKVDASGMPEIEGIVGIDSKAVRARINGVTDYVFVYNYKAKNAGYLVELIEDEGIEIDVVNTALENLTSSKKRDELVKDISKAIVSEFNNWEFEKVSKEEFEVGGKDRKCVGYATMISEDSMVDLVEAVYKVVEKTVEIDQMEDLYSEIESSFKNMPDIETTFYIYDDRLAAIILDVDGEEVEVLFQGGDARWQNVVVEYEGDGVFELKGKTSGSVEKYALEVGGNEILAIEYDAKTGDLEVEAGSSMLGTAFGLEANVKGNANKLEVVLESIKVGGDSEDIDLAISLKSGAKFSKISGKEFDLGNADEDDLEDLAEEFMDSLY